MPDCHILIARPGISVSTKFVYENLKLDQIHRHPDIDGVVSAIEAGDLKRMADKIENVLESVTIPAYPVIEDMKALMKKQGALNALMSGSGPTVFGIFEDEQRARTAFEAMKESQLAKQIFLARPFNRR